MEFYRFKQNQKELVFFKIQHLCPQYFALKPISWFCCNLPVGVTLKCAIHHERDVREE